MFSYGYQSYKPCLRQDYMFTLCVPNSNGLTLSSLGHRMKARLGELEARLGSGQKATTQSNLSNSKESDHVVEGRGTEHSAVEKTVPPDTIIYVDSLTRDGHQGESPNPSYVRDQSSLTHADRVEASSSSDGKPSQDNSCLPEAAIQDSTGFSYTPELGGGITKQFILDCLRFQNKLIDRLSIQTEPGCSDEDMYYQLMDEMPSGEFKLPTYWY